MQFASTLREWRASWFELKHAVSVRVYRGQAGAPDHGMFIGRGAGTQKETRHHFVRPGPFCATVAFLRGHTFPIWSSCLQGS